MITLVKSTSTFATHNLKYFSSLFNSKPQEI